MKGTATFGTLIPYDMESPKEYKGTKYVLGKVEKSGDGTVTTVEADNVINVYYLSDKVGEEGVADEYEVEFEYTAGGHGEVEAQEGGTLSEWHTVRIVELNADGTVKSERIEPASPQAKVEATGNTGYAFMNWTDEAGTPYADTEEIRGGSFAENKTFTANFEILTNLSYEVHYFYDGTENEDEKVEVDGTATFGTPIPYDTTSPKMHNELNYVFERVEKTGDGTVTSVATDNIVNVYYTVDEIGVEIPDEPDRIPDKYQIKFTYIAGANGSVSGTTIEVHTIQEITRNPETNEIELVGEVTPANPRAEVTVSANSNYAFNNWSISGDATGKTYSNTQAITADSFIESITFVANFKYNGGGGTGPGGGGGPSGNTEGNNRYTPPTGGPGTTTITPEDVPLAPLPESPVDVTLIDDGEVPLAPLPKTGQTSMRTTLTMMLSGIFVAVTALSKKRKEEDS